MTQTTTKKITFTDSLRPQSDSYPRYFDPASSLNRFYNELPYFPQCSDNKTACLTRPRDLALNLPYIRPNQKSMTSWLIFDLDHRDPMIWQDVGLPAPNLIVQDRNTGRSHLYYAIVPVCTSQKARKKPIEYMRAIYRAMSIKLNADQAYKGPIAKTPGHRWWRTTELHNAEYELGKLADYVDLEEKPYFKKIIEDHSHSRHEILFHCTRYYAYSKVYYYREHMTFDSFHKLVESYAITHNRFRQAGFAQDLSDSQVSATVKSIARWTWEKYVGDGVHRGVMGLDKNLPIAERQRLAAERTQCERIKGSIERVRVATTELLKAGARLSYTAVARIAQLTRQTVAKYNHVIEQTEYDYHNPPVKKAPPPADQVASLGDFSKRYIRCYQITTALVLAADFSVPTVETAKNELQLDIVKPIFAGSGFAQVALSAVKANLSVNTEAPEQPVFGGSTKNCAFHMVKRALMQVGFSVAASRFAVNNLSASAYRNILNILDS